MTDSRETELYKLISAQKKAMRIKDCFYHIKDECKGPIKQAHSIQRNGRLSIIESEVNGNMCVYSFMSPRISPKSPLEDLIPIGKKEASTFFGFCDFHDTKLFSQIENNPFDNSDKHCFLHSYRSFAHSYHRKNEEIKGYQNPSKEILDKFPEYKYYAEQSILGAIMGLNDLKPFKAKLDNLIENEEYRGLEYFVYEKEGLYPFAVSSLMSPNVTYKNKSMNNHIDPDIAFSQPMITFLPDFDKTIVILAAFSEDEKSIILLDELEQLSDYHLEKAITSLIIANCENTFFSPLFWDNLNKKEKRLLLDEFIENTMTDNYINKFFISKFNFLSNRFEINNLKK